MEPFRRGGPSVESKKRPWGMRNRNHLQAVLHPHLGFGLVLGYFVFHRHGRCRCCLLLLCYSVCIGSCYCFTRLVRLRRFIRLGINSQNVRNEPLEEYSLR